LNCALADAIVAQLAAGATLAEAARRRAWAEDVEDVERKSVVTAVRRRGLRRSREAHPGCLAKGAAVKAPPSWEEAAAQLEDVEQLFEDSGDGTEVDAVLCGPAGLPDRACGCGRRRRTRVEASSDGGPGRTKIQAELRTVFR
jgi:hypothetical protein